MTSEEHAKRAVGFNAVDAFVRDDTCIGLGTGSTAFWAIERVGERVAAGLRVRVVPTSLRTQQHCEQRNIPVVPFFSEPIDVAIDGADEATRDRALIKGGGGALFREKSVALAARTFVAIVDERKIVDRLGAFPLPVEVVPFALPYVAREIRERFDIEGSLREKDGATYSTDNGNLILDCRFGAIEDPSAIDEGLRAIHGVVATGIFAGIARVLLVGDRTGAIERIPAS